MFRRFLLALRFMRDLTYSEAAEEEQWTPDDQKALQAFVLGRTGVKFTQRLQNFAIAKAMNAVRQSRDPRFYNGTAYGVQLTNIYIDGLLPEAATPIVPMEEEDLADEFWPQPEQALP
jgi:hypothetical protein